MKDFAIHATRSSLRRTRIAISCDIPTLHHLMRLAEILKDNVLG